MKPTKARPAATIALLGALCGVAGCASSSPAALPAPGVHSQTPAAALVTVRHPPVAPAASPRRAVPATPAVPAPLTVPVAQPVPEAQTVQAARPANVPAVPTTACHSTDLSGRLAGSQGAAGSQYTDVVLTNTAREACSLQGYVNLALLDEHGRPVAVEVFRTPVPPPAVVVLSGRHTATFTLRLSRVGCTEPTSVSRLESTPPGASSAVDVAAPGLQVCRGRSLQLSALHPS